MKSDKILKEMSNIDEDLIIDADKLPVKKKGKYILKILIPVAMSVAIISFVIYNKINFQPDVSDSIVKVPEEDVKDDLNKDNEQIEENSSAIIPEEKSEEVSLPKITLNLKKKQEKAGSSQYTPLYEYDVNEIDKDNPWFENCGITKLPVFKRDFGFIEIDVFNEYINQEDIQVKNLINSMKENISEVARKMNLEIQEFTVNPSNEFIDELRSNEEKGEEVKLLTDGKVPINVTAKCDGATIFAMPYSVYISYDKGVDLPEGYRASNAVTFEDGNKALDYIISEYGDVINAKSIKKVIDRYCAFDRQCYYSYYVYDDSGDLTNDIINYNFNKSNFSFRYNKLYDATISLENKMKSLGDYPLISIEEAKKRLYDKKYYGSVPGEIPEEQYIKKVEVIYKHTNKEDKYIIPVYVFYVELSDYDPSCDDEFKAYGVYEVPAIEEKYIENYSDLNACSN